MTTKNDLFVLHHFSSTEDQTFEPVHIWRIYSIYLCQICKRLLITFPLLHRNIYFKLYLLVIWSFSGFAGHALSTTLCFLSKQILRKILFFSMREKFLSHVEEEYFCDETAKAKCNISSKHIHILGKYPRRKPLYQERE